MIDDLTTDDLEVLIYLVTLELRTPYFLGTMAADHARVSVLPKLLALQARRVAEGGA